MILGKRLLKYSARLEQVLLQMKRTQLQERKVSFMDVRNVNTKACMFTIFKGTWKICINLFHTKESKKRARKRKERKGQRGRKWREKREPGTRRDGGL